MTPDLSKSFDPDLVALNSDAASKAQSEANTASGAAVSAVSKASDASSAAVVAQSKASDASSAAAISATTSVKGRIELAIVAEVNTGTDTSRAITPDALAGSVIGEKGVCIAPFESGTDVAVGDGEVAFTVPASLNGMDLIDVIASVHTQGVTGTTDVQVRRRRSGSDVDMLSTKITIAAEYYASDETINTSNDDVQTGDQIYVDVDTVHSGTVPKGLSVTLTFRLP